MFLRIISPTSGLFHLVPQTLNNSPAVDLYTNRKLLCMNPQARLVRVRIGLGLVPVIVLLSHSAANVVYVNDPEVSEIMHKNIIQGVHKVRVHFRKF